MIKNYISIDIENPNSRGNSICSIGIVVVKDSIVVDEIYSLINPEDRFDSINSEITKLNFSDVKEAPTFKEFWNENKELFLNNIIIGHNVTYDLSVISKSLDRYEINIPNFNYLCTLQLAQTYLECESYKLDLLCEKYGIVLDNHHNALNDARAAQKIFEYINSHYELEESLEYNYEIKLSDKITKNIEASVNSLYGIVQGINYDNCITEDETIRLKKWVADNVLYKQYSIIYFLINVLERILKDNYISEYEKLELIEAVSATRYSIMYNESRVALQVLKGIIDGIISDKIIDDNEVYNLKRWLDDNDYLEDIYPYDKIVYSIKKVLEDGEISTEEKDRLLYEFNEIVNPSKDCCEKIDFNGKTFCLTGEFLFGSKDDVSNLLQEKGAIEKSGVSSKLDYLIVGLVGSDAWKYGNYGGKILKAKELQEKGVNVKIVDENILKEV